MEKTELITALQNKKDLYYYGDETGDIFITVTAFPIKYNSDKAAEYLKNPANTYMDFDISHIYMSEYDAKFMAKYGNMTRLIPQTVHFPKFNELDNQHTTIIRAEYLGNRYSQKTYIKFGAYPQHNKLRLQIVVPEYTVAGKKYTNYSLCDIDKDFTAESYDYLLEKFRQLYNEI